MAEIGSRSQRWLPFAVLAGLGVLAGQGFSRFTFGLLFPRMGTSLVGSTSTSSLLAALYAGAYLVGITALIYVTRHVAPLRLLVVGVVTSAFGLLSIGLAHSKSMVVGGLVVAGLGAAFTYVPALSFVGAVVGTDQRSRATGLAGAGIGTGIITARVLAAVFHAESTPQGWRDVWISEAVISLLVSFLIFAYALRVPSKLEERGVAAKITFTMPHWSALGLAYLCFGLDYSIYSNLAVKGWELNGVSGSRAADYLLFVAPAQIGGGFIMLWLSRRIGIRRAAQVSFMMLGLSLCEVALKTSNGVLPISSALLLGLVGAGITAQFVLVVRARLDFEHQARDATTTVFGVITLLYGLGGLFGLLGSAELSRGHGSLTSTFLVGALIAVIGLFFARRGTVGME